MKENNERKILKLTKKCPKANDRPKQKNTFLRNLKKELQRKIHMDSKIQFNPSIERRQENIKLEAKQGKNIRKEALYTLCLGRALADSVRANLED